jgi:hypothetical protein
MTTDLWTVSNIPAAGRRDGKIRPTGIGMREKFQYRSLTKFADSCVNPAMGSNHFSGTGFVDSESPVTVRFEIDGR